MGGIRGMMWKTQRKIKRKQKKIIHEDQTNLFTELHRWIDITESTTNTFTKELGCMQYEPSWGFHQLQAQDTITS